MHRITHIATCGVWVLVGFVLAALAGCGGGSAKDDGNNDDPGGGGEPPAKVDDGGNPVQPGQPGGGAEEKPKSRESVTPKERARLELAVRTFKDHLVLNDPGGFEESFLDVKSLKSVVTRGRGDDAWKAMLARAGGDEVEYRKVYRGGIRKLFEDLREPGGACHLSQDELGRIRKGATPPVLYLADTFARPAGRNIVVTLSGLPGEDGMVGLLRLRAMPHHNQRKWFFQGDEQLESVAANLVSERERLSDLLGRIVAAQKAFQEKAVVNRDQDGDGEFAFLFELAGIDPLRGTEEARFDAGLPRALREVSMNGPALTGGYLIQVVLPGQTGPVVRYRYGDPEPQDLVDAREKAWVVVAWPVAEPLGKFLYMAGPSGQILVSKTPSGFFGLDKAPPLQTGFSEQGDALAAPGTCAGGVTWQRLQ